LLVKNGGLMKTVNFATPKYVGDPINAVRIFNEKEADELIVLDIDATAQGREPNYRMIEALASECRMPLCYGGGVKTVDQVVRIIALGVEKVAVSSAFLADPQLVRKMADRVGTQSVVSVLDVRSKGASRKYEVFTQNGKVATGKCPIEFARQLAQCGVGEVVINSIDRDGMMKGFDLPLLQDLRRAIDIPFTALGGAGSLKDIEGLISELGIVGVSAGSLFVFKGIFRAVLINYPDPAERDALIQRALESYGARPQEGG
jgi:cyclase